jgi:tetratricopeptide (TPR) repeat protein
MLGGGNLSDTTLDATEDTRGFGADSPFSRTNQTSNNPTNPQSIMADCELRAELPGYSSSYIRLDSSMVNTNVGVIVLHSRARKADGMVTVASLEVPGKARKEYEKGSELLEKGNLAGAEKSLRKAIEQYPKFAEAWTRLGDLEQRRKNTDAAMDDYQEAISADPNLPLPYLRMAYLEAVAGHWEQTRKLTERLIALDPTDFPLAYYYEGVAEFNLQHTDRAESIALHAESMDKAHSEPRIELLLASVYSAKQNYSAAAQHYRTYLKLVPDGPLTEHVKITLAKTEEMAKSQSPPSKLLDK